MMLQAWRWEAEETEVSRSCLHLKLQLQVLKEVLSINLNYQDVGEGMAEGEFVKWLVAEGDDNQRRRYQSLEIQKR